MYYFVIFFFFKQKTAYEMRISDWSSDVCSSDLVPANHLQRLLFAEADRMASLVVEPKSFASERDVVKEELRLRVLAQPYGKLFYLYFPEISYTKHPYARQGIGSRSEEHTSELQSLMRISYAVFCLKKKKTNYTPYIR